MVPALSLLRYIVSIGLIYPQLQTHKGLVIRTAWALLTFTFILSCKEPTKEVSQSDTLGIGSAIADQIPAIEKKSASVLKKFATSIRDRVTVEHSGNSGVSGIPHASQLKQYTTRAYVDGLVQVGGLPRSQGAPLLKGLVSGLYGSCGGASCSRVLGVKSDEVDNVLDSAYAAVLANEKLAKDKPSVWKMLVGSLKPLSSSVSRLTISVPKALAMVASESPRAWPTKVVSPQPILSQKQIMAKLSSEEQEALTMYTYVGFEQIRQYENSTSAELKAQGWSAFEIKSATLFSQTMDRALRKLPVTDGVLYRGIRSVEPKVIANFVWHWQEKVPLGLGPKNKPAVTSTSWDPQIAKSFVFHKWRPNQDDTYGILFEIRQGHKGVGIEQIAVHTFQREVLLPKDSHFMIERIAPIEGESKVLSVILRPLPQ